jgi:hypothetical protein
MDLTRRSRLAAVLGVWTVVLMVGLVPGQLSPAHAADGDEADRTLAERYAPVVVVRQHAAPCGDGEPYLPSSVDRVLGRSDVVLRTPTRDIRAPRAADLFAAPAGSNLDLPGQVLDPRCEYESWAGRIGAGDQPTVYARVVTEPGHEGVVALQYWFWWVYNDWNDRHEGDWEMVQLVFDADDAAGALRMGPRHTAYAQHEGAELADWADPGKLAVVDGHPVVYPGQGSHAAYYTQAVWFGRSAATGFGCDDTSAPGTAVRPAVALLPTATPTSAGDPYAWLAYAGRWGQRAPTFNNGPTGPATKQQWSAPLTWVEEKGRPGSVALPPVPGIAADGFCGMVGGGSKLLLEALERPLVAAAFAGAAVILVGAAARRTRWRAGDREDPDAVDRERHTGQILVDQVRVATRLRRQLLPVSLTLFVAVVLATYARQWAVRPGEDSSITAVNGSADSLLPVMAGVAAWLILFVVQACCVAVVLHMLDATAQGRSVSAFEGARRVARRPNTAAVYVLGSATLSLLFSSFWLAPVGLVLLSLWCVSFVAASQEGLGVRDSFARSQALTRTRRLKSTLLALVLLYSATLCGPFVGGLLLLVTGWPVALCNAVAAAFTALLVPVPTIGIGLLFYDLRHESGATASVDPQRGAGRIRVSGMRPRRA